MNNCGGEPDPEGSVRVCNCSSSLNIDPLSPLIGISLMAHHWSVSGHNIFYSLDGLEGDAMRWRTVCVLEQQTICKYI